MKIKPIRELIFSFCNYEPCFKRSRKNTEIIFEILDKNNCCFCYHVRYLRISFYNNKINDEITQMTHFPWNIINIHLRLIIFAFVSVFDYLEFYIDRKSIRFLDSPTYS